MEDANSPNPVPESTGPSWASKVTGEHSADASAANEPVVADAPVATGWAAIAAKPVDMEVVKAAEEAHQKRMSTRAADLRKKTKAAAENRRKTAAETKVKNPQRKKGGKKYDGPKPTFDGPPEFRLSEDFNPHWATINWGAFASLINEDDMYLMPHPRVGEDERKFPRNNDWMFITPCTDYRCSCKKMRDPVVFHSADRPLRHKKTKDGKPIYPMKACGGVFGNFCRYGHKCNDFKSEQGCTRVHVIVPTDVTLIGRGGKTRVERRDRHLRLNEVLFAVHREVEGSIRSVAT